MPDTAQTRFTRVEAKLDHLVELATRTATRLENVAAIVQGDAAHKPINERMTDVETRLRFASRMLWGLVGALGTLLGTTGASWISTRLGF